MDNEIREILERPFAKEDIKKDYDGFDHVEPQLVVRRLNEAFGQDGWQFVPEQIKENEWSVTQYGKIGIRNEDGDWVWKGNCGTMERRFATKKPRESEFQTNRKAFHKGALSNCFKRCAMMLGIALDLYGDPEHEEDDDDGNTASSESQPRRPQPTTSTKQGQGGTSKPSASSGAQEPTGDSIGELKTAIYAVEGEVIVMKECTRVDMRKEIIKMANLPDNVDLLKAYLKALNAVKGTGDGTATGNGTSHSGGAGE